MKTRIDINNVVGATGSSAMKSRLPRPRRNRREPMTRMAAKTARVARTLGLACALGAVACGGGGGGDDDDDDGTRPDAGADAGVQPAVLLAERVFSPEERLYYLSVLPDVPTAAVDRSAALELGSADIEVYGGRVYIRDRNANTMTRYRVSSELTLEE